MNTDISADTSITGPTFIEGRGWIGAALPAEGRRCSPVIFDLKRVERGDVHDNLVDAIGCGIGSGKFEPDRPLLSESKLCAALGASRTALREALHVLATKGLVEAWPKVLVNRSVRALEGGAWFPSREHNEAVVDRTIEVVVVAAKVIT